MVVLIASDNLLVYEELRNAITQLQERCKCIEIVAKPRYISDKTMMDYCTEDDFYWFEGMRDIVINTTAEFIMNNLQSAMMFSNKYQLLERIFLDDIVINNGLYMEFGVYKGDSINFIATYQPQQDIYGFDTFEGLPENWWMYAKKGEFALSGETLPDVAPNVHLIKGLFQHTLPQFLSTHDGVASFINIDCDIYDSTKTVLFELKKRIVKGTVIVFDEFFGYPGWQQHECKAFYEFVAESGLQFEYIAFCKKDGQVAIKVL